MKFTYEVGMRIRARNEDDVTGEVVEIIADDEVRVRWDYDGHVSWAEVREIMPDTPEAHAQMAELTKQVQTKVDEATTLLDQAFKTWFEAAALQAGREVDSSDAYYLRGNPDLDLSKFEEVVERNGWSTSSLYC